MNADGISSTLGPLGAEVIMSRLACLSFLLVTASSAAASAQGLYLPNGTSGIGVSGGVSLNEDITALSVLAGYSYKSFIDGGVGVHRYGYAHGMTGSFNVSAVGLQPYVTVHALRQTDTIPVSLAGTASYQRLFYGGDAPDISGWSMFLGGSAYRHFGLPGAWSVTPEVTVGLDYLHTTHGIGIVTSSPNDSTVSVQLAGNFAYQDHGGRIWLANPFLAFDSRHATFGLNVGAAFPLRATRAATP
jgi:hypothetical protein